MSSEHSSESHSTEREINFEAVGVLLSGFMSVCPQATGVVLLAFDSGCCRHDPGEQFIAEHLHHAGFATLLIDLLTEEEAREDNHRFDIGLLANRMCAAIDWLANDTNTQPLPIGIFAGGAAGGAAIEAAARRPLKTYAIVSRGGRPDLAAASLPIVHCPTLFVLAENDKAVMELNRKAFHQLRVPVKELVIVPNTGHLFEQHEAIEHVAQHATRWFTHYLKLKQGIGSGEFQTIPHAY